MPNKDALGNALMFDYAYTLLHDKMQSGVKTNDQKSMGLIVPVAVNCAFSCELFLKSMLSSGTRGHKLNELFDRLDSEIARAIKDGVVKIMQDLVGKYSENDFDADLIANAAAFEEWRYFHEGKKSLSFNIIFMCSFQKCLKAFAQIYGQ